MKVLSVEFWLGHILVIVSTVLGVYLAAHSGLKTAIEFDALQADRDNYYLRANLRDEILFNISVTEDIIAAIDKFGTFDRANHPGYQLYVLETMKEQPNTLKTPNVIITGTLRYYDKVERLFEQRKKGWTSYPKLAKELGKETKQYRKKVLNKLEDNLVNLKARLDANNVGIYE